MYSNIRVWHMYCFIRMYMYSNVRVYMYSNIRVWQTRRGVLLRQLLAAERALILRDREEEASHDRSVLVFEAHRLLYHSA